MQRNSGKRDNRILKISMITVAVITCLFAVLKVANVFDVTKVATKTAAFVKNGFKFGAGTESDGTIDAVIVNGTSYAFSAGNKSVDIILNETVEDGVDISATKKDANQTIEGTGLAVLDLNNRLTKKIKVISADGNEENEYTVNITRNSTNKLSSIEVAGVSISPAFNPDVTSYSATVLTSITSLDVSATAYDRNSIVTIAGNNNLNAATNTITITVNNSNLASNKIYTITVNRVSSKVDDYSYSTNTYKTYTTPFSGTFKLEVWGAQGGTGGWDSRRYSGGKGGYTAGTVKMKGNNSLYVYCGQRGIDHTSGRGTVERTYNGGGIGNSEVNSNYNTWGGSGGGATDIRIKNGNWDNLNSLYSRILVAGGGSGGAIQSDGASYSGMMGGNIDKTGEKAIRYDNVTVTYFKNTLGVGQDGKASQDEGGSGGGGRILWRWKFNFYWSCRIWWDFVRFWI